MRGLVLLDIEGLEFNLVPSFENLDKLETATGKPIYELIFQMQQPKVGDITKALLACAVHTTDKYVQGAVDAWIGIFSIDNGISCGIKTN